MHNLEQLITQWRQGMTTRKVAREKLDELEDHLREKFERLFRSGMTESEAFQEAVARIGSAPANRRRVSEVGPIDLAAGQGGHRTWCGRGRAGVNPIRPH